MTGTGTNFLAHFVVKEYVFYTGCWTRYVFPDSMDNFERKVKFFRFRLHLAASRNYLFFKISYIGVVFLKYFH